MNVCERVSMFDGFTLTYTLEQWVNYSPHPTGGGDQVLEILFACCLPKLLGHPKNMKNKIRIKSSQFNCNKSFRLNRYGLS